MSRAITLGNGKILVNLDRFGQVRDFYFPRVGLENHIGGDLVHRLGVWADGRLSWTSDPGWQIKLTLAPEALASELAAVNESLGIKLTGVDLVYNEKNILLRRLTVQNLADRPRAIKIFFGHEFEMYQSQMAHTAYYDPHERVIVHYRNRRVFVAGAQLAGVPFSEYTTGVFGSEGKQGSYLDAADGQLSLNPIEHGRADSVIGLAGDFRAGEAQTVHYSLAAGSSIKEALALNRLVLERGLSHMVETTTNYWRAWVNQRNFNFYGLAPEVVRLFKQSLLVIRAHADEGGGIIASSDFQNLQQGKDTYNYVWPRDAAYAALALTRAGDAAVAKKFFAFANEVLTDDGYLMHKYSPDKSLGSSWHPWLRAGAPELPIQGDETALVIYALWHYYQISKDLEFVELIYNSLIKKAADFMVTYRDPATGLPRASYDLWEEKFGVSTFTAGATAAALRAAADFAKLLGKVKSEDAYRRAAAEVTQGILTHLYHEADGQFFKLMTEGDGEIVYDSTIDISTVYALFAFEILPLADDRLRRFWERVEKTLSVPPPVGGLARYERDNYYRRSESATAGNPWFVATLWRTQYRIRVAASEKDLAAARDDLLWVARRAEPSGLLSEQLDAETGASLSVSPLVWSHAEFVLTVILYLDKLEALGICDACNPVY